MKYAPIALSFAALSLRGETGYHVEARYPVPQPSGFDYIMLDSSARRLYLSHGTQVDFIDADGCDVNSSILCGTKTQSGQPNNVIQRPAMRF